MKRWEGKSGAFYYILILFCFSYSGKKRHTTQPGRTEKGGYIYAGGRDYGGRRDPIKFIFCMLFLKCYIVRTPHTYFYTHVPSHILARTHTQACILTHLTHAHANTLYFHTDVLFKVFSRIIISQCHDRLS